MVDITHGWDETDTKAELQKAFEDYKKASYGNQIIHQPQYLTAKQAFLSGIHYLNGRDDYSPDDIQRAIFEILKEEGFLG